MVTKGSGTRTQNQVRTEPQEVGLTLQVYYPKSVDELCSICPILGYLWT